MGGGLWSLGPKSQASPHAFLGKAPSQWVGGFALSVAELQPGCTWLSPDHSFGFLHSLSGSSWWSLGRRDQLPGPHPHPLPECPLFKCCGAQRGPPLPVPSSPTLFHLTSFIHLFIHQITQVFTQLGQALCWARLSRGEEDLALVLSSRGSQTRDLRKFSAATLGLALCQGDRDGEGGTSFQLDSLKLGFSCCL